MFFKSFKYANKSIYNNLTSISLKGVLKGIVAMTKDILSFFIVVSYVITGAIVSIVVAGATSNGMDSMAIAIAVLMIIMFGTLPAYLYKVYRTSVELANIPECLWDVYSTPTEEENG